MSSGLFDKILADLPKLHCGETETQRTISARDTSLQGSAFENISKNAPACYGIEPGVARFLYDSVSCQKKTLETGSGLSTLVFAIRESEHTAITPNASEVVAIRKYADDNQISLNRVEFVIERSDSYLPRCERKDLDLVLIDGKHAFPWPIIDWFYTADKLKQGGILVLDDLQMSSVAILRDFILEDPGWRLERSLGKRALAVRKTSESAHDVAWHMQPYITRRYGRRARLLNALGFLGGFWAGQNRKGPSG